MTTAFVQNTYNSKLASDIFDKARENIKNPSYIPWEFETSAGDILALAINRDNSISHRQVKRLLHYGTFTCPGTKCNTCTEFMMSISPLEFQDGVTVCRAAPNEVHKKHDRLFSIGRYPKFSIIENRRFGTESTQDDGREYPHFYFDASSSSEITSDYTIADYQWYINQNLPTLISMIKNNGQHGIIESLDILIDILPRVEYGDKLEKSAVWFKNAMSDYMQLTERTNKNVGILALKHLLSVPMSKGVGAERIVCTYLKQVKDNTLSAMKVATNEQALIKLLKNRFNPMNYCRPTAEPKKRQLEDAMKLFQDLGFITTLMLLSSLPKYGGKLSKNNTPNNATDIWSKKLQTMTISPRKKAAGLASRCIRFPTTIKDLIDRLDEFEGLQLNTSGESPVLLTQYPDSAREAFLYPHLWGFSNNTPPSVYGIRTGFNGVSGIIRMGRNVFFGIKNSRVTGKLMNTCFPEFMTPAYQRRCRHAFESLQETSPTIPSDDGTGYALGVGTSKTNNTNDLLRSLEFKYDNRIFEISRME